MKKIILLYLFILAYLPGFAQAPSNDNCSASEARRISNVFNYCSADQEFTTVNAAGNDVWFQFTALRSDVNISVTGAGNTGGTLQAPTIDLYQSCSAGIVSSSITTNNVTTIYKGGLIIGNTYYFRISGSNTGTFKLCLNNYTPILKPGQDCSTASVLCSKETFTQTDVAGPGANPNEAAGTCLGSFDLAIASEQNSAWYKWTAANNGSLTFTITPTANDDIDWVLYDLGVNGDCSKVTAANAIRCNAGRGVDCVAPALRYIKTGLNMTSTDLNENGGCQEGQDGFVKFVDMQQGHVYALLVNNFDRGNNGFNIEFGGSGQFLGPTAKIDLTKIQPCTVNQNFNFNAQGSTGYTRLEWTFGEGASPATSSLVKPPAVTYATQGFKTAVLQLFNDEGCSVVATESFLVGLKPDLPQINGIKPRYCIGETISLSTPAQTDATYLWTGPNGFVSDQREITIAVDNAGKAGVYALRITIYECTSDPSSVTVPTIGQTPTASFTNSGANLCTPQQTFTFVNTSQNFQTLRWNFGNGASVLPGTGGQTHQVSYSTSGTKTITLEAIGSSGCVSTFSQQISVTIRPEVPIISANKPDFCLTDTIRLSTPAQADVSYQWTGPNNFTSDQRTIAVPVISSAVAGTYSVVITRGACSSEASIVIPAIFKNPVAAFRAEPKFPAKLSFPIKVRFFNESVDADAYLWDFGDGQTSTDKDPEHTYLDEGNFDVTLTVFKSSVCSASVTKGTFMISANNILFIPNTFTPNNDAANDEFVVSITNIKTYRIQIFNRYGVSLFISEDLFDHWKGIYKNEPLPVGTYYYLINASDYNDNIIKKSGSVTILR